MPLNVPMIIYGLDLKGWSRSHNMKRISVPFKRASRKVPRRLVLPVVPKTQNPSPKEKVKVKERKEEVRIPKESPRARVAIKPERAKTTKREIVAPRATRKNSPKGSGNQNPGDKGVCLFWPKGFCRRGTDCPYKHEGPGASASTQAALFGLVTCPVAITVLCMLPTASCAFPAGGNAFAALNPWFLTRSIPTAGVVLSSTTFRCWTYQAKTVVLAKSCHCKRSSAACS